MGRILTERGLMFSASLAAEVGLNEAIAIQQVIFWTVETESGVVDDNGRRWIYNTYHKWQSQFPFWSVDTVKRVMTSLREKNLILVEKLRKSNHDHTNYYTVNWENPVLSGSYHSHSMRANPPHLKSANPPHLLPEENTEDNPISDQEILSAYAEICGGVFKGAELMTPKRKKNVKALMKFKVRGSFPFRDAGIDFWKGYFADCLADKHWRGESANGNGWKADFEFITRVENVAKVLGV